MKKIHIVVSTLLFVSLSLTISLHFDSFLSTIYIVKSILIGVLLLTTAAIVIFKKKEFNQIANKKK